MSAGFIERTSFMFPSGKREAVMYHSFKSGAAQFSVTFSRSQKSFNE